MKGNYWQRRILSTRESALVEVEPPKEVLEAERMGNGELSSMKLIAPAGAHAV